MRDVFEEQQLDRRRTARWVVAILAGLVVLAVARPSTAKTIGVLGGLILMVIIHEAGHYLVAKRAGMKVTEFFAGFGPRVWSTRKGETEYGFKALPLGGYVKIIGMNNLEEVAPEDEARTYRAKAYRWRAATAVAGPLMNVLAAVLLFFLVFAFAGYYQYDTRIHSVQADSAAASVRHRSRRPPRSRSRACRSPTGRTCPTPCDRSPAQTVEVVYQPDGTDTTAVGAGDDRQGRPTAGACSASRPTTATSTCPCLGAVPKSFDATWTAHLEHRPGRSARSSGTSAATLSGLFSDRQGRRRRRPTTTASRRRSASTTSPARRSTTGSPPCSACWRSSTSRWRCSTCCRCRPSTAGCSPSPPTRSWRRSCGGGPSASTWPRSCRWRPASSPCCCSSSCRRCYLDIARPTKPL